MLGVTLSLCKNPVRLATPSPRTSLPRRLRTAQATHSRSSMARGGSRRGGDGGTAAAATPEEVQECLSKYASALPAAVVFDLDYTCWPFWCEMLLPSHTPWLYPDVPAILDGLRDLGIKLAVASRTPTPHVANAFLDKLDLRRRFHSIQLIPAADGFDTHSVQKDVAHLPNIRRELGVSYADMLFFDDEHGNIRRVARLGVTSVLVDTARGVDLRSLERGLQEHAAARQQAPS